VGSKGKELLLLVYITIAPFWGFSTNNGMFGVIIAEKDNDDDDNDSSVDEDAIQVTSTVKRKKSSTVKN